MQATFDKALLQEAQFLRTKIVEGIREQAPGGRAFRSGWAAPGSAEFGHRGRPDPGAPFLAPVFEKYAQPGQIFCRFLECVATQLRDFSRR